MPPVAVGVHFLGGGVGEPCGSGASSGASSCAREDGRSRRHGLEAEHAAASFSSSGDGAGAAQTAREVALKEDRRRGEGEAAGFRLLLSVSTGGGGRRREEEGGKGGAA